MIPKEYTLMKDNLAELSAMFNKPDIVGVIKYQMLKD